MKPLPRPLRLTAPVLVVALLAALLAVLGTVAPSRAAAPLPRPEQDPFYDVPSDVATYAPGAVMASRAVVAKAFEIPVPVRSWQVKYRTADLRGRPTATVTTVLVPGRRWTGTGPRPLVSYQFAEDGVGRACAPSVALQDGIRSGLTNSYGEPGFVAMALAKGWAVAVPDYEGPDSTFFIAGTAARGVLDGVRAARAFAPAGLATSPVALWGYSGGAHASSVAAQLAPTYAPELHFTGVVLGGLLADVRAVIDAFSGSYAGGAIPMGINGFVRAYPELDIPSYLNERGRRLVEQGASDCAIQGALRHLMLRLSDIELSPGALDAPPIAAMLAENSPLYFPGHPEAPTFWYHARTDELSPFGPALAAARRFCREGTPVEAKIRGVGEHIQELVTDAPAALGFLTRRFAGARVVSSCGSLPAR